MSSPWLIGVLNEDGTVRSISVHCDGGVQHGGRILHAHYLTMPKIAALIELGNLSILGPEIGKEHDWDEYRDTMSNPDGMYQRGWCNSRLRDRKYWWDTPVTFNSEQEYRRETSYGDWEQVYLFKSGEWWLIDYMDDFENKFGWVRVADALAEYERSNFSAANS